MSINLAFFGLQEKPFNATPDPRFLHMTPGHREALAHPGVDAVVVATPPEVTPRIAIEALQAGKHVLSEKPMAVTLPEGRNVQAAVHRWMRVRFGERR